jgi:hypothetical protein
LWQTVVANGQSTLVIDAIDNASQTFQLLFPRGQLVGDFLELVRSKRELPDLRAVYLEGGMLDNEEVFND